MHPEQYARSWPELAWRMLNNLPRRAPTVAAWLGCIGALALVGLIVNTVLPITLVSPAQAALFSPAAIAVVAVAGLLGAWLAERTGFPAPFGNGVSPLRRFGIPLTVGLGLGALFLLTDMVSGFSRLQAAAFGLDTVVIPPPGGLIIYSAGAIYSEALFRLLPLPLLLWLFSSLLLRGQHQQRTFWALAVLTSLLEPLAQSPVTRILPPPTFAAVLAQQFAGNLAQAFFFRRYGLLASIALRLAFYLVYDGIGAGLR